MWGGISNTDVLKKQCRNYTRHFINIYLNIYKNNLNGVTPKMEIYYPIQIVHTSK